MTVKCYICDTLSKEHKNPVVFIKVTFYLGSYSKSFYFCSSKCLKSFLRNHNIDDLI